MTLNARKSVTQHAVFMQHAVRKHHHRAACISDTFASSVNVSFAIPEPCSEVIAARYKCRTNRWMRDTPYHSMV